MANAYTHGILTGEIKTFKEFAINCAKSLLSKSRDGSFNTTIKELLYYSDEINGVKKSLDNLNEKINVIEKMEVSVIEELEKKNLLQHKHCLEAQLFVTQNYKAKIESFIKKADNFDSSSLVYQGFYGLMKNQLTETLQWDCDVDSILSDIASTQEQIENIDGNRIKLIQIDKLQHEMRFKIIELNKIEKLQSEERIWFDKILSELNKQ